MNPPLSHSTHLPDPFPTTFEPLHAFSRRNMVVFRVHSSSSFSPLIWSGHKDTSGFCSLDLHLACLSPDSHTRTFGAHRGGGDGWADGAWIVHSMVDHICQKPKSTCMFIPSTLEERPSTPEDEKSPWISASRSLTWCIWEIARRLCLQLPNPDSEPDRQSPHNLVQLAIIKHHSGTVGLADHRRRYLELHFSPSDRIRKALQSAGRNGLTVSVKDAFETAYTASMCCEEVLYYGRIFAENIASNLEFTTHILPLDLPLHFLRPGAPNLAREKITSTARSLSSPSTSTADESKKIQDNLHGWLAQLVWDPRVDSSETAYMKIAERKLQIRLLGGEK
ncbi:hypothetical protein BCR39DRAFT_522389 [Naematelia encephala]|uniref:Uncharacterized protein n=1 Tax=Naematelia encephala TaxID=71784 RepID=A0A1Y2BDL9_9TREE|nr:hypothetical protein BCR39DRAFT_522389 [Naematelia encephala]